MSENNGKLLDISWATILKVGISILGFYFLYLVRDFVVLFVFALVISVLFNPAIEFLQKRGIPRILAVSLLFILIFGFVGFSVYLVSLTFISEVRQVAGDFSYFFEKFSPPLKALGFKTFESVDTFFVSTEKWFLKASEGIFSALFVVFGGFFAAIIIFSLAFFLSLEEGWVEKVIRVLFPKKYEGLALKIWEKSQQKIIGSFGVKILTSLFVGLATFISLKIFKVDYSIGLSLFAGLTNIIPFLGPLVAGLVITIIVLIDDWLKAVLILIIFILIQQIESSILGPILAKKIIGLPPVLVLTSVIIGGKLFGFLGVILAIPLGGILFDFLREFLAKKKTEKSAV
jgi:predicted PurR-regulated permease PerM